MAKIPKWKRKLNGRDILHLKKYCSGTLRGFKEDLAKQIEYGYNCYECGIIAKKIGFPVEEKTNA